MSGGSLKEEIELLRELTYKLGTTRQWKSGPLDLLQTRVMF
jgi:hypothetical protein